jgi:hypothetical protein
MRGWTIFEVPARFAPLSELAACYGFLAAVFGSTVIAGKGNDLDVLMRVRRGSQPDLPGFLRAFGGVEIDRRTNRVKGILAIKVLKAGRAYDFVFGSVGQPRRA